MGADDNEPMNSPLILDGAVRLTHWGVIRAQGDEAASFLHGQLSNDFALLDLSQARLAAYCSPKGRMLASFVALKRTPAELWLACDAQVLPASLKRLWRSGSSASDQSNAPIASVAERIDKARLSRSP